MILINGGASSGITKCSTMFYILMSSVIEPFLVFSYMNSYTNYLPIKC